MKYMLDTMTVAMSVGDMYLHIICQYKPGRHPVISSISLVNLACPYTYITDISSVKAIKGRPAAPKLSQSVNQYSPEPVVKIMPIKKQPAAPQPTKTGFLTCFN